MELVLLEDIPPLGKIGDCVTVKPGYGRNYLLPQGKAVFPTQENLAEVASRRAELEQESAEKLKVAMARKVKIDQLAPVEIKARVSSETKLFGSVNVVDIARAVTATGVEISKSEVRLPESGPIHHTGEYPIAIKLHSEVEAVIQVHVSPEAE